ncbi:efflux RND transporter permease subunit [Fibrella aquatilis]|uniref:Efflux RND transporter permease subunit n=1 Tax=Fibrella aquatilis TaxID=2817059 RepID=A0A939JXF9_9BACT|nr:efflux RND transporter permease subunit [Fibrella aquatilis]MBO0932902.1 efflux RND transporter permease subunit [Fibrella aquatilis]
MSILEPIRKGSIALVQPITMTTLMASLGLFPAALSTSVGSETQKPLATVMIGGKNHQHHPVAGDSSRHLRPHLHAPQGSGSGQWT